MESVSKRLLVIFVFALFDEWLVLGVNSITHRSTHIAKVTAGDQVEITIGFNFICDRRAHKIAPVFR